MIAIRIAKGNKPLLHCMLSDTLAQIERIGLSLTALLLAVAVTVGVDNMVQSFKQTFDQWLDKRLITEMYVRTSNEEALLEFVAARKNSEHPIDLYPIASTNTQFQNLPLSVAAFKPERIYEENWPLISYEKDTWTAIRKGYGILVNEQFAYWHGKTVGDVILIEAPLEKGTKLKLSIKGVYADYGNSKSEIMINLSKFKRYFSEDKIISFALDIPSGKFDEATKDLVATHGLLNSEIMNQKFIKSYSKNVFDKTFSVTDALSKAMIIVASLTIFTALMTLAEVRLENLAPLWALGI